MSVGRCVRHLWAWIATLCLSATALAQPGTGAITGVVEDQARAAAAGATVTATAVATSRLRSAVAGEDGHFHARRSESG